MAARLDEQVALLRDLRPHPAPRPGHVGQRPEHVERGEDRGHAVEGGAVLGREEPQEFEQFDFPPERLLLRAEYLPLAVVELRRGVALGILHCLLADVVGRHLRRLHAAHLQEKPKHTVEANFERGDAGPLDLLGLIAGDPRLSARRHLHEFVEPCVESRTHEAAVAGKHRTALAERRVDAPR